MDTTKLLHKFKKTTHTEETVNTPEQGIDTQVFGRKLGLVNRLFGCSHKDMGRPFVEKGVNYRSCVNCGARRQFNPDTFETFGNFYCPPASRL